MTASTSGLPHHAGPQPAEPQPADPERGARVPRIPPPAYYAAGFAAGMVLNSKAVALPIGDRPATAVAGDVLLAAGVSLALAGVISVIRHRTTIIPHHPVTTLITNGVYRVSRNPMYSGLAIAYLGGTLIAATWWPLICLPAVLLTVQRIVIRPEERYLTEHFGRTFIDYRERVRRWV